MCVKRLFFSLFQEVVHLLLAVVVLVGMLNPVLGLVLLKESLDGRRGEPVLVQDVRPSEDLLPLDVVRYVAHAWLLSLTYIVKASLCFCSPVRFFFFFPEIFSLPENEKPPAGNDSDRGQLALHTPYIENILL